MEGKSLLELMPYEQDKDRLRSIINKSVMTLIVADRIHLHMRNSYGSFVLVQLFLTGLVNLREPNHAAVKGRGNCLRALSALSLPLPPPLCA